MSINEEKVSTGLINEPHRKLRELIIVSPYFLNLSIHMEFRYGNLAFQRKTDEGSQTNYI